MKKNKKLLGTFKQARAEHRMDAKEGQLAKRENSAEQNGEDF
jgi:hypothetical protein